jgi:hypothetical protein
MTIRKTGAVTGQVLGVESADPEPERASGEAQCGDPDCLRDHDDMEAAWREARPAAGDDD